VVVDHDRDEDGKRHQKWHSGYRTKRDAERALTEILNRIGSGTYVDPGRQTMTEYLREWLVAIQRTVRPGTWTSYRSNIERHVVPRLGGRELRQLGASHLNVLYSELLDDGRCDGAGGLSPRSVRYIHPIGPGLRSSPGRHPPDAQLSRRQGHLLDPEDDQVRPEHRPRSDHPGGPPAPP
jgi:hypothetical protein